MSNTIRGSLLLAFTLLSTIQPGLAEPPRVSLEQKVLDKFVGDWRTTYKCPRSEWTPQETSGSAELNTARVVGGRYIQEKSEHDDNTSGSSILTYDEQRKCYRSWWFSSTGQMSESSGQWDAGSRTMTWTSTRDDVTSTTKHRFVDNDNAEWSVAVKDSRGKIYLRIEGTGVRSQTDK
jgi:hypothetical protein